MIKYLKRHQIDIKKYDACIEKSVQSRVYAFSWYLDIVADDWGVLVYDNFKAVLPIPFVRVKRNLYLKKIMQPLFCQQLGVFSLDEISSEIIHKFVVKLIDLTPKTYQFNTENTPFLKEGGFSNTARINYELNLEESYQFLKNKYSKNLKRNLQKASKLNVSVQNVPLEDVILMKKRTSTIALKNKNYEVLKKLLAVISKQGFAKSVGVFKDDELIATAFFIQTEKRIIHLISSSTPNGKTVGATSFLFDSVIKENQKSTVVLDFEGSMITGVARFFKGFGAEKRFYIAI